MDRLQPLNMNEEASVFKTKPLMYINTAPLRLYKVIGETNRPNDLSVYSNQNRLISRICVVETR